MLSFLHRGDYCWKCEFDTDVKTGLIFFHHEGEQLRFYKKVHLKTQSKKKDVLVISNYCMKRRILIYLTKAVLKRTSNAICEYMSLDES